MPDLRLAAVSYVNAWPLVEGLRGSPGVDLALGTPKEVANRLASGEADAGLVPSIELIRQDGLVPVGSAGVTAFGAVDSVLVLMRRAPHQVRTLALDPSSRTSQALARIVFARAFGVRPTTREADPVEAWRAGADDAVLVIGDPALAFWRAGVPAIDLAQEWTRLFGLPFVFAVWGARRGVEARHPGVARLLDDARDRGLGAIDAIARRAAALGPLDEPGFQVYLTRRIRYVLGPPEERGLATFLELARCST